jgi:hypothetical protein
LWVRGVGGPVWRVDPAAGPDGLWLGTPAGLFRVDRDVLD